MRGFLLAAGAAIVTLAAPASASVITLGSTYAESCYNAAESRTVNVRTLDACDNALEAEALSREDRVGTFVNRGILYMIDGKFDRANRDLDEALRLNPRQAEAWLNKSIVEWKSGNGEAAMQLAQKALDLRTNKPAIAYFVRGLANEDAGNLKAAYADLKTAQRLAPRWHEPRLELARYRVVPRG